MVHSPQTIVLHDIRAPTKKLHTFESHTDEVLHVAWSPHTASVFASASGDRRINIWDLDQIGVEQTPDDQEDGPPELLFIHGGNCIPRPRVVQPVDIDSTGHTARPSDFCWAPGEDENWTLTTTSEDNIVMVWQPTMRIWAGDEVKIDEKELEGDAMEGIESTNEAGTSHAPGPSGKSASASGATSTRSQSMSISASASNVDAEDDS